MVPDILPTDELLSVKRCAAELGVSSALVLRYIAQQKLPARDCAGRFVVRRCDFAAFQSARRRGLLKRSA